MNAHDDVIQVPIHKSLTKRLTWGGVPRLLFMINILIGGMLIIAFKSVKIALPLVGLHFLFRYFAQKDPDFFDIFLQYLKTKTFFWSE